ncbi:transcriptional regulator [Salipaludibacillus neizhouensis]|uniref:Transcriptional regulator n=1 Tax=Salipaludibacillus neizhouensis TaxID=885475 RepID=A0A3A9K3W0_9BACI|nr:metalloregulator ArsR/SmtB family transcription factor [Salipaludibacillus neizhouensis]RKL67317.1 transcriptional regulator [Salipaludibacillus neizhouensis]
MDVFNITSRKRETYKVQFEYSLLWECALGIAAITNTPLIKTLEKTRMYWEELKGSISECLLEHLNYVEEKNTWKSLLQLLHQKKFNDIKEFTAYIQELPPNDMRYICLPYIGKDNNELRESASMGEKSAIKKMLKITKDNQFFPDYIEFICNVDMEKLKEHLVKVMNGWHEEVIKNDEDAEGLLSILKTDYESKIEMSKSMTPEELVEWATGGIVYMPEPSVINVLLIPQYIYRPWNIEGDIEGTKVFYYPIANESVSPNDPYTPNNSLVLKHKALGDEVRLRIVKMLYEKELSLKEVTNQLKLGKTTVHHHLKILKSARLVEMGNLKYHLKINAINSLSKEMQQYLNKL